MPALHTLSLEPTTGVYVSAVGFWRVRHVENTVVYEDFYVDGVGVYACVRGRGGVGRGHDVSTGVRPADPSGSIDAIRRLLGLDPPDFVCGRTSLYVCIVCGDLGCATLSARIVGHEDRVDWTDIGWQVNYEESFVPEPHIGPFAFSRLSYEATLTDALHRYEELAGH